MIKTMFSPSHCLRFSLFWLLPWAACAIDIPQPPWRLTNSVIAVTLSPRDAGAVCSLVYKGKELVNDYDHGRQLQVAWTYNDLDEAYNPTEAGSDRDGQGALSTSHLVRVQLDSTTVRTVSHPAYWRHTSLPEAQRKNTACVTKDTLSKKLTLGYEGDPHVLVFDTTLLLCPELTGPPVTALRIEAPTLYASADLSRHSLFDFVSGELTSVPSRATIKGQLNERIRHSTRTAVIPVLSTPDGEHAVGFFAPQSACFWAYYTHDVPSDNPAFACNKMTAFFRHAARPGQSFNYRTFVIVGDLKTVLTRTSRLLSLEKEWEEDPCLSVWTGLPETLDPERAELNHRICGQER